MVDKLTEDVSGETNEWLTRFRAGDAEALAGLLEQYKPMLMKAVAKCSVRLGSGGDPEDLMQEASIALYRAAKTYRDDTGVTFGLYAKICVKNRLESALRLFSHSYLPVEELSLGGGNPERSYIEGEDYRKLRGKLDLLLTDYERRVLLLFLEGSSYREIAATLGKNEKSVDNALRRIRKKLSES